MDSPLVSIITPTFNHEKYILECIRSAQSQTYSNWEMIIVNDGSTDGTANLVSEFIKSDTRIKLFNQENIGIFRLGETYNFALSVSNGKYVAILEGDDIWEPEKLSIQVEELEKSDAVLAWGMAQSVSADLAVVLGSHPNTDQNKMDLFRNDPPGNILHILYFENCIPALTILIRKTVLEEIGGFKQGFGLPLVDLPTLLELSMKGNFIFNDQILGKWRIYPNQVTKTYPVEIINGRYEAAKAHFIKWNEKLKGNLNIDFSEVKNYFNRIIQIGYARSGRYKLIRKDFKGARKDYLKTIFYPGLSNFIWRVRALVGWVLSFFGTDVEWLAKALGKPSYKTK